MLKFLIDGVEIIGDIGGSLPTGQVPVSHIERIEIIRGSSSALYGSDAIGGVINIITKKKEATEPELSGSISQELSTNCKTSTVGALSYTTENFSLGATASLASDNGQIDYYYLGLELKEYYLVPSVLLSSVGISADFFNDKGKWGIYSNYDHYISHYNSVSPSTGIPSADSGYDNPRLYGGLTGERYFSDRMTGSGFLTGSYFGLNSVSASTEYQREYSGLEGEYRIELLPYIAHTLLMGAHGELEALKDEDSFGAGEWKKALHLSLFAQDDWNIDSGDIFLLTPGFRFDFSPPLDGEGSLLTQLAPKLSLKATPLEETVVRLSYGMGYKIPTLKQKYWFFHHSGGGSAVFDVYGNPDLKPEVSHGLNFSLDQEFLDRFSFSAAVYFNYLLNMIDTPSNSDGSGGYTDATYENIGKVITYGGDGKIQYSHNNYTGSVSYAYTAAKEYDDGEGKYSDLTGRIPHKVSLNSSFKVPFFKIKIYGSAVWEAPLMISAEDEYFSPDKLLVTAGAEKRFGEHFAVYIRGENLLDNSHLIKGKGGSYEGMTQEEYFGNYDGVIGTIGGRIEY